VTQVNFRDASKRHLRDAVELQTLGRLPNAGQLYGFSAECGLKALLVAHGLACTPDGDIKRGQSLRAHVPNLSQAVASLTVFPDGRNATRYISMLSKLADFNDWSIDHRYWDETVLPVGAIPRWSAAAKEVGAMLTAAELDGVM